MKTPNEKRFEDIDRQLRHIEARLLRWTPIAKPPTRMPWGSGPGGLITTADIGKAERDGWHRGHAEGKAEGFREGRVDGAKDLHTSSTYDAGYRAGKAEGLRDALKRVHQVVHNIEQEDL